jgi:diguanylate cyclase (GGDEF)-like protein
MEATVRAWHLRGFLASVPATFLVVLGIVASHDATVRGVLAALVLPVVAGAAWLVLRWLGLATRQRSLLIWPAAVLLLMVVLNLTTPVAAVNLLGLFVLAFLYVGLSQPPGTAWWCVLLVLPAYVWIIGVDHDTVLVRTPLAVLIWIFVCELPARLLAALRQQAEALARSAATDPLTGLANRAHLDGTLDGLGPQDALVLVDLDHFKRFNDAYGHLAGDDLLRDFADALRAATRATDMVVRYGGEEFLVVMPRTTTAEAVAVLERFAPAWHEAGPGVTFSAGVAPAGEGALQEADDRLYRAKAAGRARVVADDGVDPGAAEASLPRGTGA